MHGFQNNFAQMYSLRSSNAVWVKVTGECQMIKWSQIELGPGHNSYSYAWIPKLFDTVFVLEEEKGHLKHFLMGRVKVKVTLEGHIN